MPAHELEFCPDDYNGAELRLKFLCTSFFGLTSQINLPKLLRDG